MKKFYFSTKLVFLIIILIVLLIPFSKLTFKIIMDHKSISNEECISANISEMYEMYKQNEVLANDTYKNKVCVFDIVVENINEGTSGHPYISIKSDNYSVVVYFNKNQRNNFLTIKPGDSITVKARCKGFGQLFTDIEFNQAEVLLDN